MPNFSIKYVRNFSHTTTLFTNDKGKRKADDSPTPEASGEKKQKTRVASESVDNPEGIEASGSNQGPEDKDSESGSSSPENALSPSPPLNIASPPPSPNPPISGQTNSSLWLGPSETNYHHSRGQLLVASRDLLSGNPYYTSKICI